MPADAPATMSEAVERAMPALCDPWRMTARARAALRRSTETVLRTAGLDALLEERAQGREAVAGLVRECQGLREHLRQAREDLARERDDAAMAAAKTRDLVQQLKDDVARLGRERDALEAACARLEDEQAGAAEALERARDSRPAPAVEEAEPDPEPVRASKAWGRGFTDEELAALDAVPADRVQRIEGPDRFDGGMLDAMLREYRR